MMKWVLILTAAAFALFVAIKCAMPVSAVVPISETTCGRIKNTVIEVPNFYMPFWAEYMDDDPWGKGRVIKKRTCDDELLELMLAASWPDMKPVPSNVVLKEGAKPSGLLIFVRPALSENEVERYRNIRLGPQRERMIGEANYIKDAGLSYAVFGGYSLFRGWSIMFWDDDFESGSVLFFCEWSPVLKRVFTCESIINFPENNLLVRVRFTPEKMKEWQKIAIEVKRFVNKFTKRN